MEYEKQLDEALKFLVKWSPYTDGSYLYYDNTKNDPVDEPPRINFKNNLEIKEEDTRLVMHLEKMEVKQEYIFTLIFHLIGDGYIAPFYKNEDDRRNYLKPDQIKLTFKGFSFIKNGGYESSQKKETYVKNEMRYLNWVIAIGTGVSGLYVLFQILKWISKNYCYGC